MPQVPPPEPPALRCTLTQNVENGTVSLGGMVFSDSVRGGSYRLKVVKSGPSGSSILNQGGLFEIDPPQASKIGEMTFSLEVGARFHAHLVVMSDGKTAECEDGNERL
ncbi:hypothetical protein FV222_02510 [Methylobacterium sp. WL103]|uniref:curli-like amyloid fiber formation chaperone CsgH n=1 Tax=unclassified Methylobacterium TaxID=2615210 RepID=UPI0011CB441D|nr:MULTISPECIES: curli-like amyloid fiber formation chaperone CsgH [unclassified Methylobacterium]TXM64371.1 hypothetical protein FV229_18835 [Methylobacterium sp. WL120]TXN07392.1 hypothetical protein FV222_02510 [Methylobacterium sp. WL103]